MDWEPNWANWRQFIQIILKARGAMLSTPKALGMARSSAPINRSRHALSSVSGINSLLIQGDAGLMLTWEKSWSAQG